MARGLNKVMLIGNLGADPEIKYSPTGTAVANFNVATAERRKNRDGEWEDSTEWHRIVMWGKQAETCKDYLKKGSKVFIEGRIQTRSWDDQSGQRHYMTEIAGQNMIMLDSKSQDAAPSDQSRKKTQNHDEAAQDSQPSDFPQADDDLPF